MSEYIKCEDFNDAPCDDDHDGRSGCVCWFAGRAEKAEAERDLYRNICERNLSGLDDETVGRLGGDAITKLRAERNVLAEKAVLAEAERDCYRAALEVIAASCECGCRCCKSTEIKVREALESEKPNTCEGDMCGDSSEKALEDMEKPPPHETLEGYDG